MYRPPHSSPRRVSSYLSADSRKPTTHPNTVNEVLRFAKSLSASLSLSLSFSLSHSLAVSQHSLFHAHQIVHIWKKQKYRLWWNAASRQARCSPLLSATRKTKWTERRCDGAELECWQCRCRSLTRVVGRHEDTQTQKRGERNTGLCSPPHVFQTQRPLRRRRENAAQPRAKRQREEALLLLSRLSHVCVWLYFIFLRNTPFLF